MGLAEDLNNPHLFDENKPGEYRYGTHSYNGKTAEGSLALVSNAPRDATAQKNAGGDLRREKGNEWGADEGGHMIGTRFGGSSGEENLTAQNQNLNRGSYKRAENEWAAHLEQGDKVYVHLETDGEDRPNAYMGYAVIEDQNGHRTFETYHFVNESQSSIAQWEEEAAAYEAAHPEMFDDYQTSETPYGYIYAKDEDFDYADVSELGEEKGNDTGISVSDGESEEAGQSDHSEDSDMSM